MRSQLGPPCRWPSARTAVTSRATRRWRARHNDLWALVHIAEELGKQNNFYLLCATERSVLAYQDRPRHLRLLTLPLVYTSCHVCLTPIYPNPLLNLGRCLKATREAHVFLGAWPSVTAVLGCCSADWCNNHLFDWRTPALCRELRHRQRCSPWEPMWLALSKHCPRACSGRCASICSSGVGRCSAPPP